ncbi:MAG: aldose 1-epimerase family protein [Proteobacteria bacterium]|nr:aldose 1-epimerase family protein [Pseudomonadota bacterium]
MPTLFGKTLARADIRRLLGRPDRAAGVRLCRFEDGPERGVRFLEFRTGSGLDFTVLVDRGMDVGDLGYRGIPIGWQSQTGFRAPWLTDSESEGGLGIHRAFSGFLVTCGFDHIRRAERVPAPAGSPLGETAFYPLHGRGTLTPARLIGYGADWREDELVLWAEGEVRQAFLLGETLVLRRRIETSAGSNRIRIADTLANEGFAATPHMLLYHFNVGWPVLDEGARLAAPIRETVWANLAPSERRASCRTQSGPIADFRPQLYLHRVIADAEGRVPVGLVNDRLGLGLGLEYDHRLLPWLQQWQCLTEGVYVLGIEPCTNRLASRAELLNDGEIRHLAAGEDVRYATTIEVLAGQPAIAGFDRRIAALKPPPADERPEATGATIP